MSDYDFLNAVASPNSFGQPPTPIPGNGMPTQGDIAASQNNPFPQMGGAQASGSPLQTPTPAPQTPQPQPANGGQPESREAFFQSRYDKLTSYFKNNGFEVGEDPAQSLGQLIDAYKAIIAYSQNPDLLLRKVKEIYPEYVKEPDGSLWIQQKLGEEFGQDFIPNDRDALVVGSETWKYNFRMNQLMNEYNYNQMVQRDMETRRKEQEQMQQQQYFNQQRSTAMQKFNLNEEQMNGIIEKLKDPNFWSFENVVRFALAQGAQPDQGGIPPSISTVPGGGAQINNAFAEFLGIT